MKRLRHLESNARSKTKLVLPSFVWLDLVALRQRQLNFDEKSMLRISDRHYPCPCGIQRQAEQETITQQIELLRPLSTSGRYGPLYLGRRKSTEVAVRLLLNNRLHDYLFELRIHHMALFRHENVVGFLAADCVQAADQSLHMFITDYYPYGSVQDVLRDRLLDEKTALRLMYSAARGLHHLHVAFPNKGDKPQIAHLDIRSRNLLVKPDFTCVISNFRFAVDSEHFVSPLNGSMAMGAVKKSSNRKEKQKMKKIWMKKSASPLSSLSPKECSKTIQMPNMTIPERKTLETANVYEEIDRYHEEQKAKLDLLDADSSDSIGMDEVSSERSDSTYESTVKVSLKCEPPSSGSLSSDSPSSSNPSVAASIANGDHYDRRFGCSRYAAPELLTDRLDSEQSIDKYLRADVYSFALIIWEISRRCSSGGYCEQYEQPYFEHVGDERHPSVIKMEHVVVTKSLRPYLNALWFKHPKIQQSIGPLVEDMWKGKPIVRLSMLKIKKELRELAAVV